MQDPIETPNTSTEDDDWTMTYRLTVSPAAEPRPALRYRFLVPPVDQVHANAATFYYKAMVIEGHDWIASWNNDERMQAWLEAPIGELPLEEMRKKIVVGDDVLAALRGAAQADYCNWEDPVRELGANTLLPQAQKSRALGRAIALVARLQIAEHRHADAIDTLGFGYALSRHMGHTPTLVQCLIGMTIQRTMNEQTRALIANAGSPNLYWALTGLASQPVALRQASSYESQFLEFTLHELRDLDQRTFSACEMLDLRKTLFGFTSNTGDPDSPGTAWSDGHEIAVLSEALAHEPGARVYLLAHGHTATEVDAMPILQRTLLYRWRQYLDVRDDYFKWTLLPDDESSERTSRIHVEEELQTARASIGSPFTEILPALGNVHSSRRYHQRDLNLLRTIEALRMHAAQHGAWPKSLADVTTVPVPTNPVTQEPFEYSIAGDVAKLYAASQTEPFYVATGPWDIRYELTLRKPTLGK